ncbi:MAG: Gfo/Idh/MocA family protein, partial [Planctomycetota bacterium]
MKRLRLAVVGAGHLGRIHTRLASQRDDVELVAVVDPVAAAREELASQFQTQAVAAVDSLAGKIDAAIIATPTQFHYSVARDLLERGVHCLVEKPITTTLAEADALIAAARRRGVGWQVGPVARFTRAVV